MAPLNVFITGATSGIGLGIAEVLAASGHHIGFNGLGDAALIADIKAGLYAKGAARCVYIAGDLRDGQDTRRMMVEAEKHFGSIDILVNNGGIQHIAPIEDFPQNSWDDVLAINLSASFHTIAAVMGGMKARKFGRIINIASMHGLVASVNKAAYVAAKHGLVGLTKAAALESATDGVTVNAICPAWVRTPLVEAQIEARSKANGTSINHESIRLVEEKQPNKEFITPEQIGEMVLFLMNAPTITGAALPIDGGATAQ